MADFNNNIEQMYSFITKKFRDNGNVSEDSEWIRQIDQDYGNGDGTLVKSEFSYFIKSQLSDKDFAQFDSKTGNAEADKNDIINKFWAKIDTNRELKHINSTRLYNQNALDNNEIDTANISIKRHEILQDYKEKLPVPNCAPFSNNSSLVSQYRSKINESLMRSMVEKDVHPDDLIEYFDNKLPDLIRTTSADIIAQYYLNTYEKVLENMGYSKDELSQFLFYSNSQAQMLINEYIAGFKLPEDNENYNKDGLDKLTEDVRVYEQQGQVTQMVDVIGNNIQDLIQQYLGMAFPDKTVNSSDPFENPKSTETRTKDINGVSTEMYLNENSMLVRCGYDPETNETINSLQKYVVKTKIDEDLADEMSRAGEEQAPYYAECKEIYLPVMNNYVTSLIEKITVGEYNSYYSKEANVVDELFERSDYKELIRTIRDTAEIVKNQVDFVINENKTNTTYTNYSDLAENASKNFTPRTVLNAPTFYVTNDGNIKFVNYDNVHGVFNDTENKTLNEDMRNLQSALEVSFAEVLGSGRFSSEFKSNLFQAALFATMSDTSIVKSQYKSQNMDSIYKAVVKNYTVILQNAVEDDSVIENVENYKKFSILAGRNPATHSYESLLQNNKDDYFYQNAASNDDVNKYMTRFGYENNYNQADSNTYYYKDDITGDNYTENIDNKNYDVGYGDDWIYIGKTRNSKSGEQPIIYVDAYGQFQADINTKNDDNAINSGMEKLYQDYLSIYGSILGSSAVSQLFIEAQDITFRLMNQLEPESPMLADGSFTSIYGYGETYRNPNRTDVSDPQDNYDTMKYDDAREHRYVNAGSVILNIMYEFEALITKELLFGGKGYNNREITGKIEHSHTVSPLLELLTNGGTINGVEIPKLGKTLAERILSEAQDGSNEAIENIKHELIGKITAETLLASANSSSEKPSVSEILGNSEWQDDSSGLYIYTTEGADNNGEELTNLSCKELYDSDSIINLYVCAEKETDDSLPHVMDNMLQLVSLVQGALQNANLNEDLLTSAIREVLSSYYENRTYDNSSEYDDCNEEELIDHLIANIRENRAENGHCIYGLGNYESEGSFFWHTRRQAFGVSFKDLVDDILAAYNKLSSGLSVNEIRTNAKAGFADLVKRDLVHIFENGLPTSKNKDGSVHYMSFDELQTVYETMVNSARATGNSNEIKQAAILYLDYVSSFDNAETADIKNAIKVAIKNKFGDNYNEKIKEETYKPETVNTDMATLIDTISNIEYLNKTATAQYSNLVTTMDLYLSKSNPEQIFSSGFSSAIYDKNNNKVSSERITYVIKDVVGNYADIAFDSNPNRITTKAKNQGTLTANIYAIVDGVLVKNSKKSISIVCHPMSEALQGTNYSGTINRTTTERDDGNLYYQTVDLNDAYNNSYMLELSWFEEDWGTCQARTKERIQGLLSTIKDGFASKGLDTNALQTAFNKTLDLYQHILSGEGGKTGYQCADTMSYNYEGVNYTYYSRHYKREASAGRQFSEAKSKGGDTKDTGIQWNYSSAGDDTDEFYVNIRNVIDIFINFYNNAL